MKHIYAAETPEELLKYQAYVVANQPKLDKYLDYLREEYSVTELPRSILWTNRETATYLLSDIPLPGYTNEYRTVFCPDLEVWREIYLHQLDGVEQEEIRRYYETKLTGNNVLQILGHEFVHHSNLFPESFDTYYEGSVWFEEGMCEFISRKYFLSDEEFAEEARINALLVDLFRGKYGNHSLENFGAATYAGDFASIFFEYWRSFLAVKQLIEAHSGDVLAVFEEYRRWSQADTEKTLTEWFHVSI